MVQEKPPFRFETPPSVLFLFFSSPFLDNGVECFQGRKVLSMHKFRWKQESDSSSCLSQKSSEYSKGKREGLG
ncbi:hypothetical protein NC651_014690 [Populus alba x Populus x berolinensis]|nr:hypothetical protein NC651_014690 [Populus alba x Populus x berolinensis]